MSADVLADPAGSDVTVNPRAGRRSTGTGVLAPVLLGLALGGALGILGYGIYLAVQGVTFVVLAAGAAATVLALSALGLAALLLRTSSARAATEAVNRLEDQLRPMRHDLTACLRQLGKIDEHTLISERAKRVAYRDQDRAAVRQAIEEDLLAGDFASARQLADEFEAAFGYKHEAERFREEVRRRIDTARSHEIDDATAKVERLCNEERWPEAYAEADKLIGRYGGDMKIRLIRTRIEERRQQRKVELVRRFHDLRQRGDSDGAADLLKQLDTYLTPEEGRQLEEDAREVFRGKLMTLKSRYSDAMHSRDFLEALRISSIIQRDFPNSQLAKEVKAHEPRLREAAGLAPEEESPT